MKRKMSWHKTRKSNLKPVISKKRLIKKKTPPKTKKAPPKVHLWRVCPYGEHWVRTHPMHIPSSKTHPEGSLATRHEHCAKNPSGKDQFYPDEIQEVARQHFSKVKNKPCPIDLGFKNRGSQYDNLIAGWTKYWNDVFKPEPPLDPNLVKALIASESQFKAKVLANPKDQNSACGLLQITNGTRKILGNEKGELKDHYLNLTKEDLNDPSNNICAGIRWLFRKRAIATDLLKRSASWEESIAEFKGARTVTKARAQELMKRFKKELGKLNKCKDS